MDAKQKAELAAGLLRFEEVLNREFPGASSDELALLAMKTAWAIKARNAEVSQEQTEAQARAKAKALREAKLAEDIAAKELQTLYRDALTDLAGKQNPRYATVLQHDLDLLAGKMPEGTLPSQRAQAHFDDYYVAKISATRRARSKAHAAVVANA